MNLVEIMGDFDTIIKMGPSSLGHGIFDTLTATQSFAKKYNKDWDDTPSRDTETLLQENGHRFTIGKIYSFVYADGEKSKRYAFLSLTNKIELGDKLFEIGLNVIDLSPMQRAKLFKAMTYSFSNVITSNIKLLNSGGTYQDDMPFFDKGYRDRFFGSIGMKLKPVKLDRSKIIKNTVICVKYEDWKGLIYYSPQ